MSEKVNNKGTRQPQNQTSTANSNAQAYKAQFVPQCCGNDILAEKNSVLRTLSIQINMDGEEHESSKQTELRHCDTSY